MNKFIKNFINFKRTSMLTLSLIFSMVAFPIMAQAANGTWSNLHWVGYN